MIYVFQDAAKVPQEWLDKVAALRAQLDALGSPDERKAFIEARAAIWGEIKAQLLQMSHGKCWYSEAPDAVSDWHVDHFRPKNRALDEDKTVHPGYAWLAFDWMNYRIAGSFSNSPHKDNSGTTRGKWDFFPLAPGSPRADWVNRDVTNEICLILDPTKKNDPKLITFDEEGIPIPSDPNNVIGAKKVAMTIHFLFLDSPRLISARKKKWRETSEWIEEYQNVCPTDYAACTPLDFERFERHLTRLSSVTGADAAYAATARACLKANGLSHFIQAPEELAG